MVIHHIFLVLSLSWTLISVLLLLTHNHDHIYQTAPHKALHSVQNYDGIILSWIRKEVQHLRPEFNIALIQIQVGSANASVNNANTAHLYEKVYIFEKWKIEFWAVHVNKIQGNIKFLKLRKVDTRNYYANMIVFVRLLVESIETENDNGRDFVKSKHIQRHRRSLTGNEDFGLFGKGGGGRPGGIPPDIFTLLPFSNRNPFAKSHNKPPPLIVAANSSTKDGKSVANAMSRRGGIVISTATAGGVNGSATARAISVGGKSGGRGGAKWAVASAQGKKVLSTAGSDAVTTVDANDDKEEEIDAHNLKDSLDKDFFIVDEVSKSRNKRWVQPINSAGISDVNGKHVNLKEDVLRMFSNGLTRDKDGTLKDQSTFPLLPNLTLPEHVKNVLLRLLGAFADISTTENDMDEMMMMFVLNTINRVGQGQIRIRNYEFKVTSRLFRRLEEALGLLEKLAFNLQRTFQPKKRRPKLDRLLMAHFVYPILKQLTIVQSLLHVISST